MELNFNWENCKKLCKEVEENIISKIKGNDILNAINPKNEVKQNNKYIHYKNKKEYELIDKDIKIQVNNEWVNAILYKDKNGKKYVRSQVEFFEKFHSI